MIKQVSGDYILLEEDTESTEGGIVVVGKKSDHFRVVATGPDVKRCEKGDEVLAFERSRFDYEGKEYYVVKDEDIIAVVK